jgi:hypothetical protein
MTDRPTGRLPERMKRGRVPFGSLLLLLRLLTRARRGGDRDEHKCMQRCLQYVLFDVSVDYTPAHVAGQPLQAMTREVTVGLYTDCGRSV